MEEPVSFNNNLCLSGETLHCSQFPDASNLSRRIVQDISLQ